MSKKERTIRDYVIDELIRDKVGNLVTNLAEDLKEINQKAINTTINNSAYDMGTGEDTDPHLEDEFYRKIVERACMISKLKGDICIGSLSYEEILKLKLSDIDQLGVGSYPDYPFGIYHISTKDRCRENKS